MPKNSKRELARVPATSCPSLRMPRRGALVHVLAVAALLATGCGRDPGEEALTAAVKKDKNKVTGAIHDGVLTVSGTHQADSIVLRLSPGDPTTLEVIDVDDGSTLTFKRDKFDHLVVNGAGGGDLLQIDESQGIFTDTEVTVLDGGDGDDMLVGGAGNVVLDGGNGDDVLIGGPGNEVLIGGDGDDQVEPNRGNDLALLGPGRDTVLWDPGDGSDTVEGQDGTDTLVFNGSNIGENFQISGNGQRVRLFRDVGSITMDLDGVEAVHLRTLGGTDTVVVDDLAGTAATSVEVDLAASGGGGDAQRDAVVVDGTAGADTIAISGDAAGVDVTGLAAAVRVTGAEPTLDTLTVRALAGADVVSSSGLAAGAIDLTVLGGLDADVLIGGPGGERFVGGQGDDVALLGDGDDTFEWNPGDGSDTVEGQGGTDVLAFHGSAVSEVIDLLANGQRLRLARNVGTIAMDVDGVEDVELQVLGGTDVVTVGDLSPTSVTLVHVDLAGAAGGGDAQADQVIVHGTGGSDAISISGSDAEAVVQGLAAVTRITDADLDSLTVHAGAGDDVVAAPGLVGFSLVVFGEDGNDVLRGSRGGDVLFGGAGDDTLEWSPGDGSDTFEGQDGSDTLVFNGANVSENIDLSPNGTRVRLTRDVAAITLDLNGVEAAQLRTLGGTDAVSLHDLAGTGMTGVHVDLAGSGGGGDGQSDVVVVYGTDGTDVIVVAGDASGVDVTGLAAAYRITGAEAANDTLIVDAGAGIDAVDATGLAPNVIDLVVLGVP